MRDDAQRLTDGLFSLFQSKPHRDLILEKVRAALKLAAAEARRKAFEEFRKCKHYDEEGIYRGWSLRDLTNLLDDETLKNQS